MDSPTDSICFISYGQDEGSNSATLPMDETVAFHKEGTSSGGRSTKRKKTKNRKKQFPENSLKRGVNLQPEGGTPLRPSCQSTSHGMASSSDRTPLSPHSCPTTSHLISNSGDRTLLSPQSYPATSQRVSSSSSDRAPLSPQLSYLINKEKRESWKKFGLIGFIIIFVVLIVAGCTVGSYVLVKHGLENASNASLDKPENDMFTGHGVSVEGKVMVLIGGVSTVIKTESDRSSDGFSTGQTSFHVEQHSYTDIAVMGFSKDSCKGIPSQFPLPLNVLESSWDGHDEAKTTSAFYDNGSIILCRAMKCYRSSGKEWTEIPVKASITPVLYAATTSLGSKHFIVGGSPENLKMTSTSGMILYDSKIGKFSQHQYSNHGWLKGACAVGVEEQSAIYVTGGFSTEFTYSAFALFSKDKTWKSVSQKFFHQMITNRKMHGCARVELFGKDVIVLVGGEVVENSGKADVKNGGILASVEYLEVKDDFKGGWKSLEPLNIGRTNHPSVGKVGKRLVVAGGSWKVDITKVKPKSRQGSNAPVAKARRGFPQPTLLQDESLDSVEYYDEKEKRWILSEHGLQKPRHDHATLIVPASLCF